jgi:ABC-type sugar transport systems, permease components
MKKKLTTSQKKGYAQIYAMLAPNLILFLTMSVYPVIWAVRYMFFQYDGRTAERFIGLDNFVRLFTRDAKFWKAVELTFVYAGLKILFVVPIAFLVAYMLNKRKRAYGIAQAVIFTPTIMSSAVMALVFYLLFNLANGQVNRYLLDWGMIAKPINWLGRQNAMSTVVLVAVWGGLGNYMVYFLAGLQQVPTEMYESADIDGASTVRKMFSITIPMLGPVLKTILMLAILAGFQDFQSIMVMTGGGPFDATNVMFLYIYNLYYPVGDLSGTFVPQYGYGAAASIVAAAIIGVITVGYNLISKKLDEIY